MTPPDMLMGVVPNSGEGGRLGDDLGAQGSGLRARQTKSSTDAPEELTPTPVVFERRSGGA